jgi:uncharacterized protein (TIGR03437 family)
MCRGDTVHAAGLLLVASGLAVMPAMGQTAPDPLRLDWRKVGNMSVDLMLAAPATGPVDEVWFGPEGRTLYARTRSGKAFATVDFENWTTTAAPAARADSSIAITSERLPVADAVLRASPADTRHIYALGTDLYASEDGGRTWTNLTAYRGEPVIGPGQHDLAVSPLDPNQLVVANEYGVWRSLDGGLSWTGLNGFLPNLGVQRILATPVNGHGVEVEIHGVGAAELPPGNRGAGSTWRVTADPQVERQAQLRRSYSTQLGAEITAAAAGGDVVYAGSADGRIWVSLDRGHSWNPPQAAASGPIESFFVDSQSPRVALAAAAGSGAHVLRTINTGAFWDSLDANLPDVPAHGVAADLVSGAVYVATDRGVYWAHEDLDSAGPASSWLLISGNLPAARATAVALDPAGSRLYIALEGYGVYASAAPQRGGALRIVNAADFSTRPAAPGSLVSVLGGPVYQAHAGDVEFPVLASSESGAQIQVPFSVNGPSVALALDAASGRISFGLAIQPASPAIFVDRDGAPMLLDADTGMMLDASNTARSNARIQVLATGLGRVRPDWPTGMAAPLENPPVVVAAVKAYVDRVPAVVTRATLTPGYIGLYIIELQLPELVNAGPADLYVTANGQESNHVRIYLEP